MGTGGRLTSPNSPRSAPPPVPLLRLVSPWSRLALKTLDRFSGPGPENQSKI